MHNDIYSFLVQHPEEFFEIPTLSYKTTEVQDCLDRFEQAADPLPVHSPVINLLAATKKFRNATSPDGIFAKIRTLPNVEKPLNDLLQEMDHQLGTAQALLAGYSEKENKILRKAINYCMRSIRERMLALPFNDNLFLLWLKSNLRKRIEKKV